MYGNAYYRRYVCRAVRLYASAARSRRLFINSDFDIQSHLHRGDDPTPLRELRKRERKC